MDEFTDEQLDLVAKAFNNLCLKHERATSEDLVAELRKKPVTFRAGEVGWSTVIGEYLAAPKEEMHLYQGCRPLRLSEQSQALEDFVNGALDLYETMLSTNFYELDKGRAIAALNAFAKLEPPR